MKKKSIIFLVIIILMICVLSVIAGYIINNRDNQIALEMSIEEKETQTENMLVPTATETPAPTNTPDPNIITECDAGKVYIENNYFEIETPYRNGKIYINGEEPEEFMIQTWNGIGFTSPFSFMPEEEIFDIEVHLMDVDDNIVQRLSISRIFLSQGDYISAIPTDKDIQYLSIINSEGDLSALSNIESLCYLTIHLTSNIDYVGDYSFLSKLTNLKFFEMVGCGKITGDISVLKEIDSIEKISLTSFSANLDYSIFSNMENLRNLELYIGNNTNGDFMDVVNLDGIESLSLGETSQEEMEVIDLKALATMGNLKSLSIGWDCVSGDLADISNMTNLENLSIFYSSVISGDLSSLRNLDNISHLDIISNHISGDVSELAQMEGLEYLNIDENTITGDISSLQNSKKLIYLKIKGLQIEGDKSTLANISTLIEAFIDCPKVTGELELPDSGRIIPFG